MPVHPPEPRNRAGNRASTRRPISHAIAFIIALVAGLSAMPTLAAAVPAQDACIKPSLVLTVDSPTVQLGAPITVSLSATPGTCTIGFSEPVWTVLADTPFDDLVLTAAPGGQATAHSFTVTPVLAGTAQLDARVSFETQITDAEGAASTTFVEAIAPPLRLVVVDPNAEPTATPTVTATPPPPTPTATSTPPPPTATATPTTEPTATATPSPTAEASPSPDAVEPTATSVASEPTSTTQPTALPATAPSETPVPTVAPTATHQPTATPEPSPTATPTPTMTPTGTPIPSTATATPEATTTEADPAATAGDAVAEESTSQPLQPTLTPLEPTAIAEPTATPLPPLATIVPATIPDVADAGEATVAVEVSSTEPDFGEPVVLLGFTEETTPGTESVDESATTGALGADLRAVREPDSNGMLYLGIAMLALAAMSGGVILFREWLQS